MLRGRLLQGRIPDGADLPGDGSAADAAVVDAARPDADGGVGASPLLITSSPGAYWTVDGQVTEAATASADVTVVDGCGAQTWEGFGGAFNEIGWNVLSMLAPADRDRAVQLLYGDDGARFAFGRIPIGASDYAMDRYTDDEVPAGSTDPTLASFSIERDKAKLIPFIKAAQAVRPNVRLWATPWTAPTWMKQGPFASGAMTTPFDGGTIKTDAQTMTALAQYFVSFVRAYAGEGITVEAIGAQNEPNYTGTYPTCGWSPAPYATFIGQYLGPAVAAAGLTTKIMLGTLERRRLRSADRQQRHERPSRARLRQRAGLPVGDAEPDFGGKEVRPVRSGRPSTGAATTRG